MTQYPQSYKDPVRTSVLGTRPSLLEVSGGHLAPQAPNLRVEHPQNVHKEQEVHLRQLVIQHIQLC